MNKDASQNSDRVCLHKENICAQTEYLTNKAGWSPKLT